MIKNRLITFANNLRKLTKHNENTMKSKDGFDIYGVLTQTYIDLTNSGEWKDYNFWMNNSNFGNWFPPNAVFTFFGLSPGGQAFKNGKGWSSISFKIAADNIENELVNTK